MREPRIDNTNPAGWVGWIWHSAASTAQRVLKEGRALALADQAAVSATNFLTGVIIGRSCAKEEFGLYLLGMSIVLVALDIQTSLISSPYMVYSPRLEPGERARYTGSALVHFAAVAASIVLLLNLGLILGGPFFGVEGLGRVTGAVALTVTLILLREFVRRVFFANLAFGSATAMDSGVAVLQLGLLGLLAARGMVSAPAAFLAIGLSCAASAAVAISSRRISFKVLRGRVVPDFLTNWSLGRWIFASGILWTAGANLYPWFLTYFHGVAATGVWAACFGIVALGNPLLLGIQNFLGPKISHAYADLESGVFRKKTHYFAAYFAVLIAPLTVLLIGLGGPMVGFVYGEEYLGNGIVVALLGVNLLVTSLRFSFSRALFMMDCARADFLINLAALGVMMTIGVWCVRSFGATGVAAGMLIGNVCASIAKVAVFERAARGDRTAA